jgi:heme exporter protein D
MNGFAGWAAMGGYAAYVWPAYGIAAAVLGGLTGYVWRRYRASIRGLGRAQRLAGERRMTGR